MSITKNNSSSMNTIVETFIIEETAELIYDGEKLNEWNDHVEKLGLSGQKQLVNKEKSPVPFLHMNASLRNVFNELCPAKKDVHEYNLTPIPVEILGLVSLSINEKYFDKIQIWYDETSPDPACVGLRYASESDRESNYTWRMEAYLLGKWADVKHSFEELKEMAVKRFKTRMTVELNDKIKAAKRDLEDMDRLIYNHLG